MIPTCANCGGNLPVDEPLVQWHEGGFGCPDCLKPGSPLLYIVPRPLVRCPGCLVNPLPELRSPDRDDEGRPLCDTCWERQERARAVVASIRRETAPRVQKHLLMLRGRRFERFPARLIEGRC